jgi:hypothetical protein
MIDKWCVFGASVQGTSHQANDVPCQDAHAYRVLPRGELVIAVADGAGSSERSEEGSRVAVRQAVASLAAAIEGRFVWSQSSLQEAMEEAFRQTRAALDELATREEMELRAFAATLTCAVATDDRLIVGQIGDCVAIAADTFGDLFTVIQPQKGEYASETYFLTGPDALNTVEVKIISRRVKSLALTSDGLTRLAVKLPDYVPAARFFDPLWAFAVEAQDVAQAEADLATFLASERVCARSDDDKTLVLAVRPKGLFA